VSEAELELTTAGAWLDTEDHDDQARCRVYDVNTLLGVADIPRKIISWLL